MFKKITTILIITVMCLSVPFTALAAPKKDNYGQKKKYENQMKKQEKDKAKFEKKYNYDFDSYENVKEELINLYKELKELKEELSEEDLTKEELKDAIEELEDIMEKVKKLRESLGDSGWDWDWGKLPSVIKGDVLIIPVNPIVKDMKAELSIDDETGNVTITKDDKTIILNPDSHTVLVNGKKVELEDVEDGRINPLDFIAEKLGIEDWDGEDKDDDDDDDEDDDDVVIIDDNVFAGKLTEIRETRDGLMLKVVDGKEAILFHVNDDTEIIDQLKDKDIDEEDLETGDRLVIIHDKAMTRSLPPQTNALKIIVDNEKVNEDDAFRGELTSIIETKDGIMLTVEYKDEVIVFHITDKTDIKDQLTDEEVDLEDLEIGNILFVKHEKAMTRSLPPQTNALEIVVCYDNK